MENTACQPIGRVEDNRELKLESINIKQAVDGFIVTPSYNKYLGERTQIVATDLEDAFTKVKALLDSEK